MSEGRFLAAATAVFATAFATYGRTLAPSVYLIDSAPLTVAAWSLGNAHPPGFPLFLMLTHLASRLPFGTVAWRTNLASAFFAALACAFLSLAIGQICRRADRSVCVPSMLAGGLLLAFSRTLWGYATITEVYALNTCLLCAAVWLVLRQSFYAAAIVIGLALGVHHVTIGLTLAGLLVLLMRSAPRRTLLVCATLMLVTAMAVYAYLPLAASRDPVLNWGDPDNARDLFRHVTAKVYQPYVTTVSRAEQGSDIARLLGREFGLPVALVVAVIGLIAMARRDRPLFFALLVIIAAAFAWVAVYPIEDDEDAYLLPAFVALVIAATYGGVVLARGRTAVAVLLLVLPAIALVANWRVRDRSDFFVAQDYARNTLRGLKPNALVLTGDRHLWGALLYATKVAKTRADVEVVMYPLLIRSWYVEQLNLRGAEVDAYRPLLAIYENDEERWRSDAALRDEFQRRLDDLIVALIARAPHAYVTPDIAMSELDIDRNLVQRLRTSYDFVPGGIALELLPGRRVREIAPVPFELRGLADAQDEVVRRDIVPAYVLALRARARYLLLLGRTDDARASYDDALRIDPGNAVVAQERAALAERRRDAG